MYDFLTKGGDCEDYASAKYFMLRGLGFPAEDMRIVITYERKLRGYHAVLAIQRKKYACWRCPIACGGETVVEQGPYVSRTHKPEYETLGTFGAMCLNDNLASINRCNEICNRNALDTISTACTVAFAIECYENGLITDEDTGGIQLTWGNAAARTQTIPNLLDEMDASCVGQAVVLPIAFGLPFGDTLTEGERIQFAGVPSFAPELLRSVVPLDPMRAKHLGRALTQLAEEGVARVFRTRLGSNWIVGVLGALQFDVMADRIRTEYDVGVRFSPVELHTARWLEADDPRVLKKFIDKNPASIADDHDGTPVFLARNAWHLNKAAEDWSEIRLLKTLESAPETAAA